MQCRPKKGKGERWFECKYYEDCLDLAAFKNWKNFDCEACELYKVLFRKREDVMTERIEKPENTRIC
jgi:hypothetical protein